MSGPAEMSRGVRPHKVRCDRKPTQAGLDKRYLSAHLTGGPEAGCLLRTEWSPNPQIRYVEALTLSVTVSGDRAFKEVMEVK